MKAKQTKIIIAGFGGQGVVLTGNIIARACVKEDKFVTGMVSYGAEMRGGTAKASVVISNEPITNPFIRHPNVGIILNQPSLDKFESRLASGGLVVLNSSMIKTTLKRDDLDAVKIDASEIARCLGNVRVANIVALGALIEATKILSPESIEESISDLFSSKKVSLVDINLKALSEGAANCNIQTCTAAR